MFYVIDKRSGEVIQARGFWAIGESGGLYDIEDGWGCEGGGGSSAAPHYALPVFGQEPVEQEKEKSIPKKPSKVYTHRCSCGGRFQTYAASAGHCRDTKQPGPHIVSEV